LEKEGDRELVCHQGTVEIFEEGEGQRFRVREGRGEVPERGQVLQASAQLGVTAFKHPLDLGQQIKAGLVVLDGARGAGVIAGF
jgi:hypothetical protein